MVNRDIFNEIQEEAAMNAKLDKEANAKVASSQGVKELDKDAIEKERQKMQKALEMKKKKQ